MIFFNTSVSLHNIQMTLKYICVKVRIFKQWSSVTVRIKLLLVLSLFWQVNRFQQAIGSIVLGTGYYNM